MGRALTKGALLGGIILFIWMMISWMVLPWHCTVMRTFKNEEIVAQTILDNTESDGVYILPNLYEKKITDEERTALMKKGPVMFASVQRYGFDVDSIAPYVSALIIQIIGAFLVTFLLLQTSGLGYLRKVLFITVIGLTLGVLGELPKWNWWGFSIGYVGVEMLDFLIGWFLAGLVIALFVRTPPLIEKDS
ncbi:MAG: hypothetical protein WAM28_03880 [Chlamydiales bacterium]